MAALKHSLTPLSRVTLASTVAACIGVLALVACSSSSTPGPGPSPSPAISPSPSPSPSVSPSPQASPTTIVLAQGGVLGNDDQFNPVDGDTATGGNGGTVDGLNCGPAVQTYHVHAHLSLLVNGTRIAIPDTIGMQSPGPEVSGLVLNAGCFYNIHTHDADGYIHVEAAASGNFTLRQFFDIWGQPLTSNNIAGYSGQTRFFVAQAPTPGFNAVTGTYSEFFGDPGTLQLLSHYEITLEVGPNFVVPPLLPPVEFYTNM